MGIFGKDQKPAETPRPQHPAPSVATLPPPAPSPAPAPSSFRGAAPAPSSAVSTCVIGPKTHIKGEVTGEENVVVEGHVEGSIRIARDLTVGPGGTVKATVNAQTIVVAGELLGDCHASQRVHIEATGRLTGNIRSPRVVIVEGATFRGNSDMSPRKDGEA
jgi:cytoskeletal protein CcmA (bactofilin family)